VRILIDGGITEFVVWVSSTGAPVVMTIDAAYDNKRMTF
jgi:hypothetical protein